MKQDQTKDLVSGDFPTVSRKEFLAETAILITEEQHKTSPDDWLISYLSESVRLARYALYLEKRIKDLEKNNLRLISEVDFLKVELGRNIEQ